MTDMLKTITSIQCDVLYKIYSMLQNVIPFDAV